MFGLFDVWDGESASGAEDDSVIAMYCNLVVGVDSVVWYDFGELVLF